MSTSSDQPTDLALESEGVIKSQPKSHVGVPTSAAVPPGYVPYVLAPAPANSRNWRRIITLLVIGALFGVTCGTFLDGKQLGQTGPKVGVVELIGPITESKAIVEQLIEFADEEELVGVVVRVDSPGGTVGPSQEIFDAIRYVSSQKPVVASMGNIAASGGVWVSMAADEIYANPGTITGSIGVIMQTPDFQDIAQMLKFRMRTFKSGPHKDIGNPLRAMTDDEKAIIQNMVKDLYDQFVTMVAERRKLSVEDVKEFADGRIFSGRRAVELGLIDNTGGLEDAVDRVVALAVEKGAAQESDYKPEKVYPPEPVPTLMELVGASMSAGVAEGIKGFVEPFASKSEVWLR